MLVSLFPDVSHNTLFSFLVHSSADDFKLEYTNLENQKLYTSIVLKDVFGTSIYTPIEKYNK